MSVVDANWLFRPRVVATALAEGASEAARRFGVHRSTVYERRAAALAYAEDGLRVRERRPPRMPNAFAFLADRRIVAIALAWPKRGSDFFARDAAPARPPRLSLTHPEVPFTARASDTRRLALLEAQQLLDVVPGGN